MIDGDTVRFQGVAYRLSGIDAPEVGDKARCDYERRLADAATVRLRNLIAGGDARLVRVACACRPGQEGTRNCNFGRLCGSLSIGGRDAGNILISEGLAHPYIWRDKLPATPAVVLDRRHRHAFVIGPSPASVFPNDDPSCPD